MRPRTSPALVLLVAIALASGLLGTAAPALAARRADIFRSGQPYRGGFPDPDVVRVGGSWFAYSTTIAGKSLPTVTSRNGRTWRARPANRSGRALDNDAMAGVPRWVAAKRLPGGRRYVPSWAPSVGRVASGRWVAAYAAPVRGRHGKRCIGIAHATSPLGPFRHVRKSPLVCPRREGVIDPDVVRVGGRTFLLWKTSGIRRSRPTRIQARELSRDGLTFRRGSRTHTLLTTRQRWEGHVIENPSMIRRGGRFYLFYSGNDYRTSRYAIGYAVCRSPLGPCRRMQKRPLLATGGRISGPGGASAVVGPGGRLLIAYAARDRRRRDGIRRLFVARLAERRNGRLVVLRRTWG